ncbi:hypothetical protein ABPG72_019981 [Tetrahymena utriculariae]
METLNFLFNETQLKIYGDIENPIFVINDICEIIGVDKTFSFNQRDKKIGKIQGGGLMRFLFRSNSKLSEQFKDQIYDWLKEQRIQQNILHQQKILQLEQLQKDLEKEKQELNQQLQKEKIDRISKEYNHRIIQFLDKRNGNLLYVVHFDEKYRKQKIQKVIYKLIDFGYNINDIYQINDLNHYRKCDAREIISEMNRIHRIISYTYME